MKMVFKNYLGKHQFQLSEITTKPKSDLGLVVVMPVHNEPNILFSLNALAKCTLPSCSVEVILMINASELADQEVLKQNELSLLTFKKFKESYTGKIDFFVLVNNELPKKHAGVGLARKIGMDEAINRFLYAENTEGVIACFDADCSCEQNYLEELYHFFIANPKKSACSIHFEHSLMGQEFDAKIYHYIADYELHLRVYKNAMKWSKLPFGIHTVGSSMAVKAADYCKQGGMNRRKAGEDFYFLQKFIQLGNVGELTTTTIFPSPRVSNRVPFGTGRAIGERVDSNIEELNTYSLESFKLIRAVINLLPRIFEQTEAVNTFPSLFINYYTLDKLIFIIESAKNESTNYENFKKRFYRFFDAFQVLKLVHYLRDNTYKNEPVSKVAKELLIEVGYSSLDLQSSVDLLIMFRKIDANLL